MNKKNLKAPSFTDGGLICVGDAETHLFTSLDPDQAPELWWQVNEKLLSVWELDFMNVFASRAQNSSELLTRLKLWNICENVGRYLLPSGHGLCVGGLETDEWGVVCRWCQ